MMERQLGRESQKDNDLFYTCSLIDYIARKTKNKRVAVVDALGKERIAKIYDLADIYHSFELDIDRNMFKMLQKADERQTKIE